MNENDLKTFLLMAAIPTGMTIGGFLILLMIRAVCSFWVKAYQPVLNFHLEDEDDDGEEQERSGVRTSGEV